MCKSIKTRNVSVKLIFFVSNILLLNLMQPADSRKCVDPFLYLECCPNIYNVTVIDELNEKCQYYHLTNDPPFKTTKRCKKLFCTYECIADTANLVSIK